MSAALRLGRQILGWTLLFVGVLGLVLPVLPGWFLIGWGVVMLAPDIPLFARLLDRVEKRVPSLRRVLRRRKSDRTRPR